MIELEGNEPDVVEQLLRFMYFGDYSDGRDTASTLDTASVAFTIETQGPILMNARVYAIAEQYDVQPLKARAKDKYEEVVRVNWDPSAFLASVELLYRHTPESDRLLRDVIITATREHASELIYREDFATLCVENGDIAFDILRVVLTVRQGLKCCDYCDGQSAWSWSSRNSELFRYF